MVMEIHKQFIQKSNNFEIIATAGSGTEAVELASATQPDVMLLDIYLPDMDGLSVLKKLRALNVPTDIILITAARDAASIQEAFRYGAVDYIIKPFKYDRLKKALDTYSKMIDSLGANDQFSQEQIDLLSTVYPPKETAASSSFDDITDLPKGLNKLTLRQIVVYLLKQTDAKSAEEVAEGIGLARVTARRYLEFLENIDKVKLEVQYGSVGRPVNRYRPIQ
ncbi:two-component system response regulator [Desulfuribacillus alkaliarsenatis]|uniref:Transcriptional regulatory protein n=2 Tax=Desulfuribacillus alkaliarsenatis TaxID=766136 RepID=A0A1E5G4J4_9FIRM|nr:two-component system response regulator [Desulfuribacillus alkaliarsenatis]